MATPTRLTRRSVWPIMRMMIMLIGADHRDHGRGEMAEMELAEARLDDQQHAGEARPPTAVSRRQPTGSPRRGSKGA